MYLKGSLCVLALVWLATPPAQAATELNGVIGRELIGQDVIPTEYHGLWGREGNCAELQQPFFMNAVFVTKKSLALDKRTCPINTALAEGDEFEAAFNCITVGEDTLQTLPIRLTLREAKLYVKVGEEREDFRVVLDSTPAGTTYDGNPTDLAAGWPNYSRPCCHAGALTTRGMTTSTALPTCNRTC